MTFVGCMLLRVRPNLVGIFAGSTQLNVSFTSASHDLSGLYVKGSSQPGGSISAPLAWYDLCD